MLVDPPSRTEKRQLYITSSPDAPAIVFFHCTGRTGDTVNYVSLELYIMDGDQTWLLKLDHKSLSLKLMKLPVKRGVD